MAGLGEPIESTTSTTPATGEAAATPPVNAPLSQADLDLLGGGQDAASTETEDAVDDWFGDATDAEDGDGDGDEAPTTDGQPTVREAPPEDPTDYELQVKGVEITEQLEPLLNSYQEKAFETGINQTEFNGLASWFVDQGNAALAQRAQEDKRESAAVQKALQRTWGESFDDRKAQVQSALKSMPPDLAKAIRTARVGDGMGHKLINDYRFIQMLANMSGERGERSAPAPRRGEPARGRADVPAPFRSELEMARHIMKTDFDRYLSEGWDKRYQAILARRGE